MYRHGESPWWSNFYLIAALLLMLFIVPRSPAMAQETQVGGVELLTQMMTPPDDNAGIPASYNEPFAALPYTCDYLNQVIGDSSRLLEGDLIDGVIELPEPLEISPGTEEYFDQECEIMKDGVLVSIPASTLLGYERYRGLRLADLYIDSRLKVYTSLKYGENLKVGRVLLALSGFVPFSHESVANFEQMLEWWLTFPDFDWYYLQFRITDEPLELMDELTWEMVVIARFEAANMLVLPNGAMIPFSFQCPEDIEPKPDRPRFGAIYDGEIHCTSSLVEDVSDFVGLPIGKYPGIYYPG